MAKEVKKLVKEDKLTQTWSVPSYSDGKLVGWGQCVTFKEEEALLAAIKNIVTLKNIKDSNRQIITDCKNNVRKLAEAKVIVAKIETKKATVKEINKVLALRAKGTDVGLTDAQLLAALDNALKAGRLQ